MVAGHVQECLCRQLFGMQHEHSQHATTLSLAAMSELLPCKAAAQVVKFCKHIVPD